ncbi:TRAP transporter fused permease subunit [Oscillibacter hominis]|uniref:TRAP transporter fused permease subunit n=1 Tax=Oscillibacter hominis TaxID=2763056 RepID=A0A7G9B4Y8_9FIRM|nr:TRAP transporter fused permease subunit [Oscillibacter hominis]QNL44619.1 TRAP transporter fused permease subunit [Oscillibacter hominis]
MDLDDKKLQEEELRDEKRKAEAEEEVNKDNSRLGVMPPLVRHGFTIISIIGILIACYYMMHLRWFGVMSATTYYYTIFAVFGCSAFLLTPATKKYEHYIPWFDYVLTLLALAIPLYFAVHGMEINMVGWVPAPDNFKLALAVIYSLMLLEMVRRGAGKAFFCICVFFGLYPLVCEHLPGMLAGIGFDIKTLFSYYCYGSEGIAGLPGNITGTILIGFLMFANLLICSGAGPFFIDLAQALCGKYRGGTAKVAVLTSAFFGMLSGSPISNVVSSGSITIPAMKKSGYDAVYAGGIEAVAATGGILMPPVMGSIVFVMVAMSGFTYAQVMVAAIFPALCYYGGLLLQVDAYAANRGMKGLSADQCPKVGEVLKRGWYVIVVLIFLCVGLVFFRWGEITPYYASGLLIVLSWFDKNPKNRLTPKNLYKACALIGKAITQICALMLPFTFTIAGLITTGMAASFATSITRLGGENIIAVVALTIIACYLMGMMGMDIVAYMFFAVSVAPALVGTGLDKMAVHLFLIYYPLLAVITPPVATVAFVASSVAGAPAMKTGWKACQLGCVVYFLPLYFLYEPAILLQGGNLMLSLYHMAFVALGTFVLASGLGGYMIKLGKMYGMLERLLFCLGGILIAFPRTDITLIGLAFMIAGFVLHRVSAKRSAGGPGAPQIIS